MFEGDDHAYTLRCKICRDSFTFKNEGITLSKWIDHIKSHYIDKDLAQKEWIAKDMIYLNYDSVLEIISSYRHNNDATYRELTECEGEAYRNALHRIRSEESMTKSKGR
jgi:hypothetical protein